METLIDSLLSHGGCMVQIAGDSAFTAPSYNCLSESEKSRCEGRGCGVVLNSGAILRKTAASDANFQSNLIENEIVIFEANTSCDSLHDHCTWRKVSRANGGKGFIPFTWLRTESDGFIRIEGTEGMEDSSA